MHYTLRITMEQRIQKILAAAGVASRRNIEQMILEGRITVNGKVMRKLPVLVDPATDKIAVDGEPIRLRESVERRIYLLMNKPKGVVCTNVAQGEQTRAIDLLPPNFRTRVYPVGQLDADSKGLLILTNDGELTNALTHPRYGVAKTYRALVDGRVTPETIAIIEKGMWLADKEGKGFKTGRTEIEVVGRQALRTAMEITIREGRNREIRRMFHKLGHKVRDLIRTRLGPLTLHGLPPGHVRALTEKEVRLLRKTGREKPEARNPKPESNPKAE